MRKIFYSCLFCFLATQIIDAQTIDRSFASAYLTSAAHIQPYGADKWLIGGRTEPEPGAYFQDELFVAIIDNNGQVLMRKNLPAANSEIHYWHDLLALPDGGILAVFESTLCDVGADVISVQRYDNQGTLIWQKNGGFVFGTTRPPEKWFVAPDGNLLGAGYDQIWKLNTTTGDVIWQADLLGVNGGSLSPYDFALVAGTENFFALGTPSIQKWKQGGTPAAPVYLLDDSISIAGYRRELISGPNGDFYCWRNFPFNKIEHISPDLQVMELPMNLLDYGWKSLAFGQEGMYLAESSSDQHAFRRFDLMGGNEVSLLSNNLWLSPLAVAANNGRVALVGEDGSGSPNWSSYQGTCTGAWLRIISESAPNVQPETPDAAVVEIEQNTLIDSVGIPYPPMGNIYNLDGGDFRIKISNNGNLQIDNVCVNVVFDYNRFFDICTNVPAIQKQYSNLHLAPGESAWLDFGDIHADGQQKAPYQICFWTSSPNEQPDANHFDDRFCHVASYTSAIIETADFQLLVTPIPADEYIRVAALGQAGKYPWRILDAFGRQAKTGTTVENEFQIATKDLPNGFYVLQIANRSAKWLVHH